MGSYRARLTIYILMVHPVLLGFIAAIFITFLHIKPQHIIYGAITVFSIGLIGIFYETVIIPPMERNEHPR